MVGEVNSQESTKQLKGAKIMMACLTVQCHALSNQLAQIIICSDVFSVTIFKYGICRHILWKQLA